MKSWKGHLLSFLCVVAWGTSLLVSKNLMEKLTPVIAEIGAMNANLYVYAVPVVTMIASAVFLDERITWGGAIGVVLVVGGMLIWSVRPVSLNS